MPLSPALRWRLILQVQYPKIRLEEEGATVTVAGGHPAGTKYTGKFGTLGAPLVPHIVVMPYRFAWQWSLLGTPPSPAHTAAPV
jgi:hypothetical protein